MQMRANRLIKMIHPFQLLRNEFNCGEILIAGKKIKFTVLNFALIFLLVLFCSVFSVQKIMFRNRR